MAIKLNQIISFVGYPGMHLPSHSAGSVRIEFGDSGCGNGNVEGHLLHVTRLLPKSSQPGSKFKNNENGLASHSLWLFL